MEKAPFKMKGFSYPGTSPIKDSQYDINGISIDHTHDGGTEGSTLPHGTLGYDQVDEYGNPKIDFGISWGSGAGFGPIISGHGAKQIGKFARKVGSNISKLWSKGVKDIIS
tara:strand:+ start:1154 stop:1486 length:333 start_codon:yes stop_codon:yes gene_type:complete